MRLVLAAALVLLAAGCRPGAPPAAPESTFARPGLPWQPRCYSCERATAPLRIDGRLDEAEWGSAAWTEDFVDIEGPLKPAPTLRTRARMLWDDEYFYFAAEMEEPQLWATLRERDSVIYQDHDFEIFIDPDGDNHHYYELEINAFGTEWDLFLVRPYRDGAPALHAWDIPGLKSAVRLEGTLNDPSDVDEGWTVEVAIPWKPLAEAAGRDCPPEPGDRWRVNFSRVEWLLDVDGDGYRKRRDERTGEKLPEHNWVWSPQGLIAMHVPERWGFVSFDAPCEIRPADRAGALLMDLYYRQRDVHAARGAFTDDPRELGLEARPPAGWSWPPELEAGTDVFRATLLGPDGRVISVDHEGRLRGAAP